MLGFFVAEEEGFEPPVPLGTTVFKTAAIDHSATPLIVEFSKQPLHDSYRDDHSATLLKIRISPFRFAKVRRF